MTPIDTLTAARALTTPRTPAAWRARALLRRHAIAAAASDARQRPLAARLARLLHREPASPSLRCAAARRRVH
jgi:hypothetical protein